jgi:hypothetical protein
MKLIIKVTLVTTILLSTLVGCSKDEVQNQENNVITEQAEDQLRWHVFPWEYIMDTRFSRDTCGTGPGVCYSNEGGDIFGYGTSNDPNDYVGEVQQQLDILMEGNNDPEVGVVAYRLIDNTLQIVFSRSLEEQNFVVSENYELRSDLAEAFGRSSLILPRGEYQVDRSNFEHGEVRISLR